MSRYFPWTRRTGRYTSSRATRRPLRTILTLTRLEERQTPAAGFGVTGAAFGNLPNVVVTGPSGATVAQIQAYDPAFRGGVNVALGELDGNPATIEIVTGAGPTGGPHVKVFSVDTNTGAVTTLASFMAYDPSFRGGVNVVLGNFTGIGPAVVTGPGFGGGPQVRTWTIANGTATPVSGPLGNFMAFDPAFRGGASVVAGEFDGTAADGAELAVGAGPTGGPQVNIYRSDGSLFASFMAFDPNSRGGVSLGVSGAGQLLVNDLATGGVNQLAFASNGTSTGVVLNPGIVTTSTTGVATPGTGTTGTGTNAVTGLGTTASGTLINPVTVGAFNGAFNGNGTFFPQALLTDANGTVMTTNGTVFVNDLPVTGTLAPNVNPLTFAPTATGTTSTGATNVLSPGATGFAGLNTNGTLNNAATTLPTGTALIPAGATSLSTGFPGTGFGTSLTPDLSTITSSSLAAAGGNAMLAANLTSSPLTTGLNLAANPFLTF